MKLYKLKETSKNKYKSIPSIKSSKSNKNNKMILSSNPRNKNKKTLQKNSLSSDNFPLKSLQDLSLYIANIPSINDIKITINDYYIKNNLNKKGFPIPLISKISTTSVKIDFPNEKILNGYKTYISFLKYENPLFKNIIIKKNNLLKAIRNIKLNNINTIKNLKKFEEINNIENNEKNSIAKNIIKLYQHNKLKYKLDNESFSFNTLTLKKIDDNDKIIINYYKNQKYLRNSSPYLSEEDKRIINERENKKKFMTPKGFFTSVGKYSCPPKFISNYVQMSPSENPSTYRFRPVNKLKWITKRGFIIA